MTSNVVRLGIDIGSTTVKVAFIDEDGNILFSDYKRHFAKIRETLSDLLSDAYKKLGNKEIHPMITGSGGLTLAKHLGIPFTQEVIAVSTSLRTLCPGTDVAIDSADIVLMNSSLSDVASAVRLSRATLRNIRENLFWAFFYNAVCIPLAAGLFSWKMNPMIGAAAMSLSSFTVCMNALRLNLFNMHDSSKDRPLKNRALPEAPEARDEAGAAAAETPDAQQVSLRIDGMMCHHCENAIKKALEQLPFVSEAAADFETGVATVTVSGVFDEAAVRTAVESEDYGYLGRI